MSDKSSTNRTCKGICKKFQVKKPIGTGRYDAGQARCQICETWISYRGCHFKNGQPATEDSLGWFCNCCNYRVRTMPRNKIYKEKLKDRKLENQDNLWGRFKKKINEISKIEQKTYAPNLQKSQISNTKIETSDKQLKCYIHDVWYAGKKCPLCIEKGSAIPFTTKKVEAIKPAVSQYEVSTAKGSTRKCTFCDETKNVTMVYGYLLCPLHNKEISGNVEEKLIRASEEKKINQISKWSGNTKHQDSEKINDLRNMHISDYVPEKETRKIINNMRIDNHTIVNEAWTVLQDIKQEKYQSLDKKEDMVNLYFHLGSIKKVKEATNQSEETIRRYTQTSKRLPPKLRDAHNRSLLSLDPKISLNIALHATDFFKWDGEKENQDRIYDLAINISKFIKKARV